MPDVPGEPMATTEQEPIVFLRCERPTLGVELELFVVDPATGRPVDRAPEVLARLEDDPRIKPEFFRCMLEINTGVCESAAEARRDLRQRLERVRRAARDRGLALIASGTHPTADWREHAITDDPRYAGFVADMQLYARRLLVGAVHVHVGVPSGEHAVAAMNALACFVPHFIALSAASPYWQGDDTGLASARVGILDSLSTTGLPLRLDNWSDFVGHLRTLLAAGAISTIREVWWDIRPHPDFGTVELRVCDATGSLDDIAALAALAQCLVAFLCERYEQGLPLPALDAWSQAENKWRAARWAGEAELIRNLRGDTATVAAHLREWLGVLAPYAQALGCARELLEGVPAILERGPGARRQRAAHAEAASCAGVLRHLIDEVREEARA